MGQYRIFTAEGFETKYTYSKLEKDAEKKLNKAIFDRDSGSSSVSGYLSEWLDSIKKTISGGS